MTVDIVFLIFFFQNNKEKKKNPMNLLTLSLAVCAIGFPITNLAVNVTFRQAAANRGFLMGSNGNSKHFTHDSTYSSFLSQQYSLVYPENECLFATYNSSITRYFNFALCEKVLLILYFIINFIFYKLFNFKLVN